MRLKYPAALLLSAATLGAATYEDIPEAIVPRAAVERIVDLGILRAFQTKFHPEMRLTRYRLAVIAARLLDMLDAPGPAPDAQLAALPDVPDDHWAAISVHRAVLAGLMRPYRTGWFSGEKLVDKANLAVLYAGLRPLLDPLRTPALTAARPRDIGYSDPWRDAIEVAVGERVLGLFGADFQPWKETTRLELALFLDRVLPVTITEEYVERRRASRRAGWGDPPDEAALAGFSSEAAEADADALVELYAHARAEGRAEAEEAAADAARRYRAELETAMHNRVLEVEFRMKQLEEASRERDQLADMESMMNTPKGLLVPGRRPGADPWATW